VERFNGNHETASITKVLSNILPPSIPRPANYMHECMTLYDAYKSFFMLGVLYSMGNNHTKVGGRHVPPLYYASLS